MRNLLRPQLLIVQLWVFLVMVVHDSAFAAAGAIEFNEPLKPVTDTICNMAAFMSSSIGLAVAVLAIAIGVVMKILGMRGAMAFVIGGIVGAVVLVALPALVQTIAPDCDLGAAGG